MEIQVLVKAINLQLLLFTIDCAKKAYKCKIWQAANQPSVACWAQKQEEQVHRPIYVHQAIDHTKH